MKTRIFKPVFSLMAVAFAAFGAFAFSTAPEKAEVVDIWGLIPSDCSQSTVKCSSNTANPFCTSGSVQLYDLNAQGTDCPVQLYRK